MIKNRKGVLIKKKIQIQNSEKLEKKYGKIQEIRKYANGRLGVFLKDGQFRFVKEKETDPTLKKSPKKSITNKCKCSTKKCKCGCNKGKCKCSTKKCKCGCNKGKCKCSTKKCKKKLPMKGGRSRQPIALKTAIHLLRDYYTKRYL